MAFYELGTRVEFVGEFMPGKRGVVVEVCYDRDYYVRLDNGQRVGACKAEHMRRVSVLEQVAEAAQ